MTTTEDKKVITLDLEATAVDEYKKATAYMKKNGISPSEVVDLAKAAKHGNPYKSYTYNVGTQHSKFLVTGDWHVGNKEYDPALLKYAVDRANVEKVDFWLVGGDLFDGWYQNRPASIFEQNAIGLDQQLKMILKGMKPIQQPVYFITANHEYNTFMRGAGIEVGHYLESKLKDQDNESYFLGNGEGTVMVNGKTKVDMLHPDGGTAYALSYRPQKILEALEGGKKPKLLTIHHFHKAEYLFYRNVHALQAGTMCGQTKFMKGKNISAHKGFWIVDMYTKDNGQIDSISPIFYPSYK